MADELIIEYNLLPEIMAQMEQAVSEIVAQTAKDLAAAAAAQAPVDTGFLQSSVYYATATESTYGQNSVAPPGDSTLLPEVDHPTSKTEAAVAVGASYGIFQEYGTRFQPAQPYFTPATEAARATFVAALSDLEAKLKGGSSGGGA